MNMSMEVTDIKPK